MLKKKNICRLMIFFFILAISVTSVSAFSETKQKNIIKNCKNIRDTLKSIQYADTDSRTYLPRVYDEILDNYIIPLNTRLLKNDSTNKLLSKNQDDFIETYREFKADFITYSRSMEELLKIDCETDPKGFYSQLEIVRTDRNYINIDVEKMNQLIKRQKAYVTSLKEAR